MTHPDPARTDVSAPTPLTAPIAIGDVHGCLAELDELRSVNTQVEND